MRLKVQTKITISHRKSSSSKVNIVSFCNYPLRFFVGTPHLLKLEIIGPIVFLADFKNLLNSCLLLVKASRFEVELRKGVLLHFERFFYSSEVVNRKVYPWLRDLVLGLVVLGWECVVCLDVKVYAFLIVLFKRADVP